MTSPQTTIRFLHVTGERSHSPAVLAIVDGYRTRWRARFGWDCQCQTEEQQGQDCWHVDLVLAFLDERVLRGEVTR